MLERCLLFFVTKNLDTTNRCQYNSLKSHLGRKLQSLSSYIPGKHFRNNSYNILNVK